MEEKLLVKKIVNNLKAMGWIVNTEVANLYRSADIAAIDIAGNVVVIECKISNMKKALEQSRTHKISADRVAICTPLKSIKEKTVKMIKDSKIGLMYFMPDGSLKDEIKAKKEKCIWPLARERLYKRILEGA